MMGWAATIGIRTNLVRELSVTCGSHTKVATHGGTRSFDPLDHVIDNPARTFGHSKVLFQEIQTVRSREFRPFDPLDHVIDNPARMLGPSKVLFQGIQAVRSSGPCDG